MIFLVPVALVMLSQVKAQKDLGLTESLLLKQYSAIYLSGKSSNSNLERAMKSASALYENKALTGQALCSGLAGRAFALDFAQSGYDPDSNQKIIDIYFTHVIKTWSSKGKLIFCKAVSSSLLESQFDIAINDLKSSGEDTLTLVVTKFLTFPHGAKPIDLAKRCIEFSEQHTNDTCGYLAGIVFTSFAFQKPETVVDRSLFKRYLQIADKKLDYIHKNLDANYKEFRHLDRLKKILADKNRLFKN